MRVASIWYNVHTVARAGGNVAGGSRGPFAGTAGIARTAHKGDRMCSHTREITFMLQVQWSNVFINERPERKDVASE